MSESEGHDEIQNLTSVACESHTVHKDCIIDQKDRDLLLNPDNFGSYVEKNRRLLHWLETHRKPLTFEALVEYLRSYAEVNRMSSTITVARFQVKRIVRELIDQRPDEWTVLDQYRMERSIDQIKVRRKQNRTVGKWQVVEDEEIEKLISNAPKRLGLIIATLAETGMRVSELTDLEYQDCVVRKKSVHAVVIGKGGKQRTIYISLELWQQIIEEYEPRVGPIFLTDRGTTVSRKWIWRAMRRESERILDRPVNPHMLRHSIATRLIRAGADIKSVSDYLGHSTVSVTGDMYVHTTLAPEELRTFKREGKSE